MERQLPTLSSDLGKLTVLEREARDHRKQLETLEAHTEHWRAAGKAARKAIRTHARVTKTRAELEGPQ